MATGSLFSRPCVFVMGCAHADGLPPPRYPEVAFAGRSNVGKSSLINALVGKKGLAKASSTPGRTREVNFFLLGETLMLVDLPGYGYAKASRKEASRWGAVAEAYLTGRAGLKRVCLLIDARVGVKDTDEMALEMLGGAGVAAMLVLTKVDALKPAELEDVMEAAESLAKSHGVLHPNVIAVSARTGLGLAKLRSSLAALTKTG